MILKLLMSLVFAHTSGGSFSNKPVMLDLTTLKALGIEAAMVNEDLNVAIAYVDQDEVERISHHNHALGRCGGYEDLSHGNQKSKVDIAAEMRLLEKANAKEKFSKFVSKSTRLDYKAEVAEAIKLVNPNNLKETVTWLSSYTNRYHESPQRDDHVKELKTKLEKMLADYPYDYDIRMVSHTNTPQSSLAVTLNGSQRPSEYVILGGHLDSINQMSPWVKKAPGADDNASGSANLVEALRILIQQGQPQRTIEFFWYAGEERGLLGSADLAKEYKRNNVDVISVMQIDMSLNPGAGKMVIGSINDNTSAWLRDLMVQINDLYIGITIEDFNCGYGCSDHASWYRQGFATFAPFEATMNTINRNIHTANDVINANSDFEHSAVFSKISIGYAMHMANSNIRGL